MEYKNCNTCNKEKQITNFAIRNKIRKTYHNRCKDCTNIYAKSYRETNNETIKEKQKKWYKEKGKSWKKNYDKKNNDRIKKYERNKYKTDFSYRFRKVLRTRLNKTLKGIKFSTSIIKYTGIDLQLLRKWLEYQFDDKMNWNNYGKYWDIDHVKPCISFDLSDEKNVYLCFNWRNLQPLEKTKNYKKNRKINYNMCLNQIDKILKFESLYIQYQDIEAIQCRLRV